MTRTRTAPTLFDFRTCPRCERYAPKFRRHKDGYIRWFTCTACGALLAYEHEWLECERGAHKNVGLLRMAIKGVRPDIARMADAAEIVALGLLGVVKASLSWDESQGSKFWTWAAEKVKYAARGFPNSDGAVTGVAWDRMESRAG